MNKKNAFLAVLIVIGVLFFIAFAAGFKFNAEDSSEPAPESYRPGGLMKGIGSLLAPLAPSVDGNQLHCNRQSMKTIFLLTPTEHECHVNIPASKEQYRTGTLRMKSAKGPAVMIVYQERNGEQSEAVTLTPEEPLRLVFLEQGGVLTLKCDDCEASGRSVRLKLE